MGLSNQPYKAYGTVDLLKRDTEIKILVGCTEKEMDYIYDFHNESQYMKGILIRR